MPVNPRRLLLIHDDENLRPIMQGEFEEAGWPVDTAPSPGVALETFDPERHCAVLIDLRLDEGPHMKLISALRDRCGATHLIVLTDRPDNAYTAEALRRGASSLLTKPVSLSTIQTLLRAADAPSSASRAPGR